MHSQTRLSVVGVVGMGVAAVGVVGMGVAAVGVVGMGVAAVGVAGKFILNTKLMVIGGVTLSAAVHV